MIKYPQLQNKDWLQEEIIKRPMRYIAHDIGCSYSAVLSAARRFQLNIPKRTGYIYTEETRKNKSDAQKAAYAKKYPEGRFGTSHPHWQGGIRIINDYVAIYSPAHPRAGSNKCVFEHILVAEKTLGRYLLSNEIVHHLNGNKQDNRPENLEVVTRGNHVAYHMHSGKSIQDLLKEIIRLKKLLDDHNISY